MTTYRRNIHWREVVKNRKEFRLVWLDSNINDSDNSIYIQKLLLQLDFATQFYTDFEQCMDLIKSIENEHVLLIVSAGFADRIRQQIHHYRSVSAMFIFCIDNHEEMPGIEQHTESIDQYTNQESLLQAVSQTIDHIQQQDVFYSVLDQKQKSARFVSKDSALFLWHQMLLYVLKQMPHDDQAKQNMVDKCQHDCQLEGNEIQMKMVKEFEENYNPTEAIKWFTKDGFLYRSLNTALRTEDIDALFLFRFYIIDLCAAIENQKINNIETLKLYRGQKISIVEMNKLKENIDSIISLNGFLSTSRDINVARAFASSPVILNNYEPILFEICVKPTVKTVSFADISTFSHIKDEQEVLFNLNSLFIIRFIDFDEVLQIRKIKLETTDEGVDEVNKYLISVQDEINDCPPIVYFGRLLLYELGETDRAEKFFRMLLESCSSKPEIAAYANNWIGIVYHKRGKLKRALYYYQIAYDIRQAHFSPDHAYIAHSYYDLATIKEDEENFSDALDLYKKAFDIYEKNYHEDNINKAETLRKIGITYRKKGELEKALGFLSDALEMFQRILPANHSHISICMREIGFVYLSQKNLDEALKYFNHKLEMDQESLPSNHRFHSGNLECIANTYTKMGKTEMALNICQQQLATQKNKLGENHIQIAQILIVMAKILADKDSYEAMGYYDKALSILERSTPINYDLIASCLRAMNGLYLKNHMEEKRLERFLKVSELYYEKLPSDHVEIANICRMITSVYQHVDISTTALNYLNESFSIYQNRYGSQHGLVQLIESIIIKLRSRQETSVNIEPAQINVNENQNNPVDPPAPLNSVLVEENLQAVSLDAII